MTTSLVMLHVQSAVPNKLRDSWLTHCIAESTASMQLMLLSHNAGSSPHTCSVTTSHAQQIVPCWYAVLGTVVSVGTPLSLQESLIL